MFVFVFIDLFKGFYSFSFEAPLSSVLKSFSYTLAMSQYSGPVVGMLGSSGEIVLAVIDCNFMLVHRHLGWRRLKFWVLISSLVSFGWVFCL